MGALWGPYRRPIGALYRAPLGPPYRGPIGAPIGILSGNPYFGDRGVWWHGIIGRRSGARTKAWIRTNPMSELPELWVIEERVRGSSIEEGGRFADLGFGFLVKPFSSSDPDSSSNCFAASRGPRGG